MIGFGFVVLFITATFNYNLIGRRSLLFSYNIGFLSFLDFVLILLHNVKHLCVLIYKQITAFNVSASFELDRAFMVLTSILKILTSRKILYLCVNNKCEERGRD